MCLDFLQELSLLRDDALERFLEVGLGGGIAAGGIDGGNGV
jgi:hypothetical protein